LNKNYPAQKKLLLNRLIDYLLLVISISLFSPSFKWIFKAYFSLYEYFNLALLIAIATLLGNKYYKNISLNFSGLKFQVPFTLVLMTLPFGKIMEVYIGFPLRLLAVDLITQVFQILKYDLVTSATILTVENNAMQVDFSCSGLKGVWAGFIFYFAITWLDELKINLNWLFTFIFLQILIISANFLRILCIVLLTTVYDYPKIAEILHAPLGTIGFTFACAIIYFFIKTKFYKREIFSVALPNLSFLNYNFKAYQKLNWTKSFLILTSFFCLFILKPKVKSNTALHHFEINKLSGWAMQNIPLSAKEKEFFLSQNSKANKMSFTKNNISGAILFVESNGWRGHHNPETCLRGTGNKITSTETIQLNTIFPIKWLKLNKQNSACYWFQSDSTSTDDFGTRVWEEIVDNNKKWIQVSIVFDKAYTKENTDVIQYLTQINQLISHHLHK